VERAHLTKIKNALDSVSYGLAPLEANELEQINNYLNKVPVPTEKRISPTDLRAAFGIKTNVFRDTAKL